MRTPPTTGPARAALAFGAGAFCVQFDSFALNTALPAIGADLGLSGARLPLTVGVYLLACAAAMVPGGRIGDAVGHRAVLACGLALFGAGSLLCALAPTGELLIAFRALQGVGGGLVMPSGLALVGRDARAAGLALGAAGSATALGPVLGGMLTELAGWRWVFAGVLPITAAALVAAVAAGSAGAPGKAADGPREGAGGGTGGTVDSPREDVPGAGTGGGAGRPGRGAGLGREFAAGTALGALANAATVVWLFAGPVLLQGAAGLTPAQAGPAFALPSLAMAAAGPAAGRIADRFPALPALALLTSAGCAGLAALPAAASAPLPALLALLTACGLALGTANALALIATRRAAPEHSAGLASGIAKTAVTAAGGAAMAALGALPAAR
ncbi:MFS transporter [Nocardiopsis sp. CNT-189]|uniref:MFS transporter n=1 Tax=Nocardiopsis oceanisediminis TaxID=2816862 RepID=UPI003B38D77F